MLDADFLSFSEGGEKRMKFKNGTTEMNARRMSDEEANLFSLQLRSEAFFCSSFSIFFLRVRTKNSRGNQSTWTWSGKKITMEKLLSMEQIMFMKLADQSGALVEALC